jgi:hypothetical protein
MRRQLLVYVLIPAVLLAAAGLAYYSYRLSSDVAQREQRAILDTTRELAQEKVYGIESELIKSDTAIFEGADIENLLEFQQKLAAERPAVQSVVLLDEDWKNIPGGSFNRRRAKADMERFRQLFEIQVVPDLKAMGAGLNSRSHIHTVYDGRPYLFSFTRRISGGRLIYVVVEADLTHLVFTVFPEYFANKQSRVYQVVDDLGEIRYGYPFTNVPESRIVELRFPETVSGWRLRVAQPEAGLQAARGTRQFLDLALIGTALVVIVAGIGVLLLAARRERLANELKSEFISNVSHELKTPLSIIHMFGEMLHTGRTKSPEQARDYAGVITRESTRLARLIDNVLDFSRIERGADFYEFRRRRPGRRGRARHRHLPPPTGAGRDAARAGGRAGPAAPAHRRKRDDAGAAEPGRQRDQVRAVGETPPRRAGAQRRRRGAVGGRRRARDSGRGAQADFRAILPIAVGAAEIRARLRDRARAGQAHRRGARWKRIGRQLPWRRHDVYDMDPYGGGVTRCRRKSAF